jgi:DNA-binding response OmpR family regulator
MTSPVTILLLDEEPMLRRATALLLTNRGATVTAAANAEEAAALAAGRVYDVAVLDLAPGNPGAPAILARIRAQGIVPSRVITLCGGPAEARAAAEVGQVLEKPYAFERLLGAVFGARGRGRTRSGVFPRAPRASAARLTPRRSRRAARAARDPG